MPSPSSSARQALEALGGQLRELRLDAGLTGRDLGRLAGWHSSKVSKIEYGGGRHRPTRTSRSGVSTAATRPPRMIWSPCCAVWGMFVGQRAASRAGVGRAVMGADAALSRIYSSWLIPGPIRTADYIRAVLTAIQVRRNLPDDVDDAVAVRVAKRRSSPPGQPRSMRPGSPPKRSCARAGPGPG